MERLERLEQCLTLKKNVRTHYKVMAVFCLFFKEFHYYSLCETHRGLIAVLFYVPMFKSVL